MSGRWPGDLYVDGHFRALTATLPNGTVTDSMVNGSADIVATKLQHEHRKEHGQPNAVATAETKVVFRARGAGTIVDFVAGSIAKAVGDSTCTVNLLKNGTTVSAAPITLNSSSVNYTPQAATITVAAFVANDVFTIVITPTVGTGTLPFGVYGSGSFRESGV